MADRQTRTSYSTNGLIDLDRKTDSPSPDLDIGHTDRRTDKYANTNTDKQTTQFYIGPMLSVSLRT